MNFKTILAGSAIASLALFSDIGASIGLPEMPRAEAAASVSVSVFYDRLARDGDWVRYQDDYVFIPANVRQGWRPYTDGRWIYADRVGWTWASDESFGWATYHYGRWGYADDIGWYWVPGTRWAPAWVSWRKTNDHVVWAPLPPRRGGVDVSVSIEVGDVPDFYWVAVPTRRFLEPNLRVVIVNDAVERRRIVQRADVVGTVRVQNNIVINTVIDVDVIEREAGRKVRRVAVRDTNDPVEARASDEQVTVFSGEIKADADTKPKRIRDVKEARKIKRDRAGEDAGGSENAETNANTQDDSAEDATGTTTRQNGSGANTRDADSEAGEQPATGAKKRERTKRTNQAAPDATEDASTEAQDAGDDQQPAAKKVEKRQKSKAAGQATKGGNGADVTLPAENDNGNGADVTQPEQAQQGKAKADQNRKRAQQKQKAAPAEQNQNGGQKAQKRQQSDDQGGAQKPQRKKDRKKNCDPADPSCGNQ
jgi:hypothetical protein